MQTKREYLAGLNPPLAIAGARGRFSRPGMDAIAEAEKNGIVFSDSAGRVRNDSVVSDSGEKPAKDSAKVGTFSGPTPAKLYDGGWYILDDGVKVILSGAEVCRTPGCMVSLDWHRCLSPVFPNGKGEFIDVLRMVGNG